MATKEEDQIGNEIEFLRHGKDSEIWGTCWYNYDKDKIEADNVALLGLLKETKIVYEYKGHNLVLTMEDGTIFLDELPNYFQSYIAARKKQ